MKHEDLRKQIESLNAQKKALSMKNELLARQLSNQPKFIDDASAQKIMDARDDVEYFRRRLDEAQRRLNDILHAAGVHTVSIRLVSGEKD